MILIRIPVFTYNFSPSLLLADCCGIYHQVNEEDHTRVISMEKGGNMKRVFARFCTGLKMFEDAIKSKGQSCVYITMIFMHYICHQQV